MNFLDQLQAGFSSRLPVILQTEAAECGLACLAMVAGYYGSCSTLSELRRRFGLSLRGATLKDLIGIADRIGLASRPIRLEPDELSLLSTPCILHWDLNHFVVLKQATRNGIIIHDPGAGVRRLSHAEVLSRFTGIAVEFSPVSSFESGEPPPRVRISALTGRMMGLKRSLGMLAAIALAIEVFAVISPFFLQWVVDEALVTADQDLLLTLVLGFSLLLLIRVAVTAMRGWMLITISSTLKVMGRSNLFSHLVNLPASYFEARHLGDVMSRFGSQETILQAITTDMVEALLDGLMSAITLAVMFLYAPGLATVVLAGAFLYALLRWGTYTSVRHASIEAIIWAARRDSHFLETMRGIKTIKLFNAQESRRAHWLNLLVETINRQIRTQKLSLIFKTSNSLLVGGIAIFIVWLGAQRVLEKTFSVGMLFTFIAYKDQFLYRVSALTDKALDLYMLRLHAERLADIALTTPEPRIQPIDFDYERLAAGMEVKDLRFRYSQNDPWVLDGVNLKIEPGESVAIVGASGCGKTTLLRILVSLLQPESGEILIDGQPLQRFGIGRYRSMIGVVLQDDQLFAGSIADNISFFSEEPSQQRIEECAIQAAVHDDICRMPMAYGTLIGDMGTVLSGGQKQRVLIARALYNRPGILLLDEATSHLDIARERAVNDAIRKNQMTRIIVAHRPETILSASRVIVLEKGRVVKDISSLADKEALVSRTDSVISQN